MSTDLMTAVSVAEYLEMERRSELKHELRDGEIVPMPGGTYPHNRISSNANGVAWAAFQGRRCEVFGSDMRVRIPGTDRFVYPDFCAACGELIFDDDDRDTLLNPSAVLEVLSPSTEAYDRGEKFEHYRRIPTLTDYVLVAQDRVYVEHYARQSDGSWLLRTHDSLNAAVTFAALPCTLSLAALYDKVVFE